MQKQGLKNILDIAVSVIGRGREGFTPEFKLAETGRVTSVSAGIASISGLPGVAYEELVKFPGELYGIAFNIGEEETGVVLLGHSKDIHAGDRVERTGRVMDVPTGDGVIGRVINPLGFPLDGKGAVKFSKRLPIERSAPPIMDREPVSVPLQTGIKVLDALIPIGRGQRELILGDRQTGKTAIAVDTILNQKDQNVICIYCAIGQRAASVAKVIADLREKGAMDYSVVMVTEGNDAPGLKYIAPYAATSIAEGFMEEGKDVLVVYDDLTQHARAYREISLLLRRPPGREAFPGDIFYIHSRLLERATHLKTKLGGGSLTALPIVETEAQDISSYIPTNLISITDGQIFLSPRLFELGLLPAVDISRSVSRVGSKAQLNIYHSISGRLKLAYSQFEELESFARFGTKLDDRTRGIIEHGHRIRESLKQEEATPASVPAQVLLLLALSEGFLDDVPIGKVKSVEILLRNEAEKIPGDILKKILSGEKLPDSDRSIIKEKIRNVTKEFYSED
jgi:F-type H+/Na+-transporting ATPase subunit alpha